WGLTCILCSPLETNLALCCFLCSDGVQPKRCFSNISGYCRKKCKLGEISEMGCMHAKLCCVNELENKRYLTRHQPVQPHEEKSEELKDYIILPTITYFTISL
ncbi:beta-defensin 20, partial [Nannospalax galili]|uniref:beta-defensin 20 n=1 Tax=Nannospalax galili TaxID=1026970 RepID=UPI0004ED5DF2